MSVWLITGASRGFGLELTRQALDRGDQVAATAGDPNAITRALPDAGSALLPLPLDVTNASQAATTVSTTLSRFGRIDSLINNAGRGLLGAVEEVSDAEARAVFEVNVFGLLTVTRAVLPVMRGQGAGKIINISSSGGFIGRAGWGIYSATKFAVEGLTESMRHELAPLGIQVTAIEPGGFRTNFLDDSSLLTAETITEDYAGTAGAMARLAEESGRVAGGGAQQPGCHSESDDRRHNPGMTQIHPRPPQEWWRSSCTPNAESPADRDQLAPHRCPASCIPASRQNREPLGFTRMRVSGARSIAGRVAPVVDPFADGATSSRRVARREARCSASGCGTGRRSRPAAASSSGAELGHGSCERAFVEVGEYVPVPRGGGLVVGVIVGNREAVVGWIGLDQV
jgi:NAD(P)-dependent dehydrogenase (short-subunit alcohol dehydrogenase family)